MKPRSNIHSAPDNQEASQLWITQWIIEKATLPGHVSVGFVVAEESQENTKRSRVERFLLPYGKAVQLIDELKELLQDAAAIQCLEENASHTLSPGTEAISSSAVGSDDTERGSNHFELGAYGLVGN